MDLHVTTVFLADGLLSLVAAVSLVFLAVTHGTSPGLRRCMAAIILIEVGILIVGFEGRWIDALPILVGKGAILSGAILLYDGLSSFLDKPRRWAWHVLALSVWIGIFLVFHFVHLRTDYRGEAISLMLAAYSALLLHRYRRWVHQVYGENWFMLGGFLLTLCLAVLLFVYTALYGGARGELPVPPTLHSLYVIAAFASGVLIGFGLLVLDNQRSQVDLRNAAIPSGGSEALITMCASCRRVSEDHETWSSLETYLALRTDMNFTHTICPDCARRLYPGVRMWKT